MRAVAGVASFVGSRLDTAEITTNGIVGDRVVHVRGPEGVRTSRRYHDLLGLPSELLFWSGVALIPFVATLVMVIRPNAAPTGVVAAIVAINFAWVAASLFVAFGPVFAPTLIGKVFVCAQAAMVLLFGELQVTALRRSARALA